MSDMHKNKIIFFFGTKAQFIKSYCLLKELNNQGVQIKIINTCQHIETTSNQIKNLSFGFEYKKLSNNLKDIGTVGEMLSWFFKCVLTIFSDKRNKEKAKYCILHGDTASTLLGIIWAKSKGLKIIHLESGWRSGKILKPFPEEIIRQVSEKFSNILVPDGTVQLENLKSLDGKKEILFVENNTLYDAILENVQKIDAINHNLVVTIHRSENLFYSKNLKLLVDYLISLKNQGTFAEIDWYCHEPTYNTLKKKEFISKLLLAKVNVRKLIKYEEFIHEISVAKAVLTDGGGVAKEASLLNVPLVIWREEIDTDHQYIKNIRVYVSNYNTKESNKFFEGVDFNEKRKIKNFESPSKIIADLIKNKH